MEKPGNFQIDERKKETIRFQNKMLHYGLYTPEPENGFWTEIPWHWHDEFEFGSVEAGTVLYKTNHHEYILHKGDGIFINSGTLHYLRSLEPGEDAALCSHFFDRSFLAGYQGSIYDIKYMVPVQERKILDARPLYREKELDAAFLGKMRKCAGYSGQKEPFFELRIRSCFSELWETVYHWAMEGKEGDSAYDPQEDERIKSMLSVIQEHYSEKIAVSELARAAHISERECYRIFQNILGTTPGNFMVSVRLQKAQELLWNTDKSILDIALETGFGTSSYFCKIFKACCHITPNQYRKSRTHEETAPRK